MALRHTVHGSSGDSFYLELPFFRCSIDRKNLVLITGSHSRPSDENASWL
jgi:hypothetical protein